MRLIIATGMLLLQGSGVRAAKGSGNAKAEYRQAQKDVKASRKRRLDDANYIHGFMQNILGKHGENLQSQQNFPIRKGRDDSRTDNKAVFRQNLVEVNNFFRTLYKNNIGCIQELTYSSFYGTNHRAADHQFPDWLNATNNFGKPLVQGPHNTVFSESNKDTAVTMLDECKNGFDPVGLNLANSKGAGGGVATGANAQEESLCRSGFFYWLQMWLHHREARDLVKKQTVTGINDRHGNPVLAYKRGPAMNPNCYIGTEFQPCQGHEHYPMDDYTKNPDRVTHNSNWNGVSYVPFNVQLRECHYQNGQYSYNVSKYPRRLFKPLAFICKAAENFSSRDNKGGPNEFRKWWHNEGGKTEYIRRLRGIAYVAWQKGHDCVVLGAFGCGAFSNDPVLVAHAMNQVFRYEFRGVFQKVIFCMLGGEDTVRKAFQTNFIYNRKGANGGNNSHSSTSYNNDEKTVCRCCTRSVNPGRTSKGNPYDTCCLKCVNGNGHTKECDRRNQSGSGSGARRNSGEYPAASRRRSPTHQSGGFSHRGSSPVRSRDHWRYDPNCANDWCQGSCDKRPNRQGQYFEKCPKCTGKSSHNARYSQGNKSSQNSGYSQGGFSKSSQSYRKLRWWENPECARKVHGCTGKCDQYYKNGRQQYHEVCKRCKNNGY